MGGCKMFFVGAFAKRPYKVIDYLGNQLMILEFLENLRGSWRISEVGGCLKSFCVGVMGVYK